MTPQLDLSGKAKWRWEPFELTITENKQKGPKRKFGPYLTPESVFHELGRFERKEPGHWRILLKLDGGAGTNPRGSTVSGTYSGALDNIVGLILTTKKAHDEAHRPVEKDG
jgi:hypothetical protein